jgi:hypothetical protein
MAATDSSAPALARRLAIGMLAALGETPIGDEPAVGYIAVRDDGERQFARITQAGRAWLVQACPPARG